MKKSKLKAITAVLLAFIIIGVFFAALGAGVITRDKKYMKSAESESAFISSVQIENGERKYILWYNAEGKNYQPYYDDYNEDDYIGKEIKVYFTKGSPEKIFIKTEEKYFIFLYAGLALAAVSALILAFALVPVKVRKYIKENGKTELVRIEQAVDVIGGQKILCDSTKIRGKNAPPFKSKTIKQKLPKEIVNTTVTVYYLPKRKNFYYVDTETIKKKDGAI